MNPYEAGPGANEPLSAKARRFVLLFVIVGAVTFIFGVMAGFLINARIAYNYGRAEHAAGEYARGWQDGVATCQKDLATQSRRSD